MRNKKRIQGVLKRVLSTLEHVSKRPGMYIGFPNDVGRMGCYLWGLQTGCAFAGLEVSREIYERAAAARGWKTRATGIEWHMRHKKLTDEAIVQELVAVQIDAFQLAAVPPPSEEEQVEATKKRKPRRTKKADRK